MQIFYYITLKERLKKASEISVKFRKICPWIFHETWQVFKKTLWNILVFLRELGY